MSFIIQPASEIIVRVSWNLLSALSWRCYNKLFWVQIRWPFQESSSESLGAGTNWGLCWWSVRFNTLQAKNSVCSFSARKVIANSRPILPSCDDREPKEKPDGPQLATVLVHTDADQQVWSLVWESLPCHWSSLRICLCTLRSLFSCSNRELECLLKNLPEKLAEYLHCWPVLDLLLPGKTHPGTPPWMHLWCAMEVVWLH